VVVGKRSDGHSKTQPKPLRNAAIEHAKELTQQHMADGIDKGRKKKKRKDAPHLLDQGRRWRSLLHHRREEDW